MSPNEKWATPYEQACDFHALSGPALAEVAREVLSRGHSFRFLAPGTSMSPFIRNGDVVTLAPFDSAACALGDVVAFVQPGSGRLVVHRVVEVANDNCRIQGDNNPTEDGQFPFECITGTVARVERDGRTVLFGLGPERAVIAWFSRRRWLHRSTRAAGVVYSRIRRSS